MLSISPHDMPFIMVTHGFAAHTGSYAFVHLDVFSSVAGHVQFLTDSMVIIKPAWNWKRCVLYKLDH